jgi:hypothetical protein
MFSIIHVCFHIIHMSSASKPKTPSGQKIAISEGNKETCSSSCSLHASKASICMLLLPKYAGKTHAELRCVAIIVRVEMRRAACRRLGSMRAAGVIGRGSERCGWMVIFRDAICGGIVTREVF